MYQNHIAYIYLITNIQTQFMKRSMLLVLAGFGLASMLFALVAFVGVEEESNDLIHVRVVERFAMGKGYILIAYPDGKNEKIEIETNPIWDYKRVETENLQIARKTISNLKKKYELLSYTASTAEGYYVENYLFQTQN